MTNQRRLLIHGETKETIQTENEELTNTKNTSLFSIDDAKRLTTSRRLGRIKELFYKFKEFIKSKSNELKSKGEDKGKYD